MFVTVAAMKLPVLYKLCMTYGLRMTLMLSEMCSFVVEIFVQGQGQNVGVPDYDVDATRIAFFSSSFTRSSHHFAYFLYGMSSSVVLPFCAVACILW